MQQPRCKECGSLLMTPHNRDEPMRCSVCPPRRKRTSRLVEALPYWAGSRVPLPRDVELRRTDESMSLTSHWFQARHLGLLGFGGVALFWSTQLIEQFLASCQYQHMAQILSQPAYWYALCGIWGAIVLLYTGFAGLLNETRVSVDRSQTLTIRYGPLFWRSPKPLQSAHIDQLYTITHQGRGSRPLFSLWVMTRSGQRFQLVADLDNREQALAIAHEIERFLQLNPRPIPVSAHLSLAH